MKRTTAFLVSLLTFCLACGGSEGPPDAGPVVTRWDSAGIEIVLSDLAQGEAPAFAVIDENPSLRIGSLEGAEEEQFGSVRDLAPTPEGGVAVLDRQAALVRVFGHDGSYVGSLGSKGEGPGELADPAAVAWLPGDTVAVYDWRTHRITRYPAAGGAPDVRGLQGDGGRSPYAATFFPDGRLVGSSFWFAVGGAGRPEEGEESLQVDSTLIAVYSASGSFVDTTAVIPNRETIQKWMRSGDAISIVMNSAAFARSGVFSAHPDGVWAGFGDRWQLALHDASTGAVRRILRAPALERELTEMEVGAVRTEAMAEDSTPADRERREIWWELSPRPEIRPTFDRILVDDEARLWLREWPGAGDATRRWWVFQREGDLLGYVDAPAGLRLMAISGGNVWGVFRGDFDVPYVVRHGLTLASD